MRLLPEKSKCRRLSPLETEPRPQARPTAPVTVETQGTTLKNKETISAAQIKAPVTEPQFASLSFAWNMPVSLAVFKRQNKLWIVFDHSQQIDIKELRNMAGDLAENIFQFPHPGATIIQLTPKEDVQFFVRKEGLLWIVDLFTSDQKPQPVKDMTIFTQYDSLNRPYLFIPTEAAGNIVSVIDPTSATSSPSPRPEAPAMVSMLLTTIRSLIRWPPNKVWPLSSRLRTLCSTEATPD